MNAKTGRIEFNSSGTRVNYDLSLYNHGGTSLYKKVFKRSFRQATSRITILKILILVIF